ncbi:MAG: hypothetical protein HYT86_02090 [candidate division NC10 bacterium]|nr:hypothetical protein [candidate division NC10 bacterium]
MHGADESRPITYDDLRVETVLQAAKIMASSAITARKSGGQLFLRGSPLFMETVIVHDGATRKRLAAWMRTRGRERKEQIWFRDAAVCEAVDAILFVGLKDWYPPVYDCGACGYATCAEFLEATKALRDASEPFEFKGPQCNLRDIDLGIAVGSAAKTARKLGLIQADVAVALSLSMTHKSIGFDRRMPEVDFSAADPDPNAPASTRTLPIGAEGGEREGGRHKQQRVTDVRHRKL